MPEPQSNLIGESTHAPSADEWREKTDAQLLTEIAQGQKAALTEFITRYYRRIIDFAQRHLGSRTDAEDIAQESFIRIWRKAPLWQDRNLPAHSWLYRIAYNLCVDELRRRRPHSDIDEETALSSDMRPEENVYATQQQQLLAAALDALPLAQRTAIVLCNYQGLSNRDAATVLDVSVEALESLLSRGRAKLRHHLLDT